MLHIKTLGTYGTQNYEYVCTNCLCTFIYSDSDIDKYAFTRSGTITYEYGIKCPCCGEFIPEGSLRDRRNEIRRLFDAETVYNKAAYKEYDNTLVGCSSDKVAQKKETDTKPKKTVLNESQKVTNTKSKSSNTNTSTKKTGSKK